MQTTYWTGYDFSIYTDTTSNPRMQIKCPPQDIELPFEIDYYCNRPLPVKAAILVLNIYLLAVRDSLKETQWIKGFPAGKFALIKDGNPNRKISIIVSFSQ